MKTLRAFLRLLCFAFYTIFKIGQIIISSLLMGQDARRSMRIRQYWAKNLLPAIGIRVSSTGTPPDFPCILMSNHRSYLDPVLIVRDVNAFAVSKAEVAKWPIIGFGAKNAGVLFLKRESTASRKKTLEGIAGKLQDGFAVLLFPEGTTHSELRTSSFKPGGFKMAAAENFPIVPVAIDYASAADHWIGADTFLPHFFRRFGEPYIHVQVHYGEAIWNDNAQELLDETQNWIDATLEDMRESWQNSGTLHPV